MKNQFILREFLSHPVKGELIDDQSPYLETTAMPHAKRPKGAPARESRTVGARKKNNLPLSKMHCF